MGDFHRFSPKQCIHEIKVSDCWCWVRSRNWGLVNGQQVEFIGDKIKSFTKMDRVLKRQ